MNKILKKEIILELHRKIILRTGGSAGLRDGKALDACLEQPLMTFDGVDLYPTKIEKGASMGFFLIANHPFIDGNKRIGLMAMNFYLALNGFEIQASVDEQEAVILAVASGEMSREDFTRWVKKHVVDFPL